MNRAISNCRDLRLPEQTISQQTQELNNRKKRINTSTPAMKIASNDVEIGFSSDAATVWATRMSGNKRVFARLKKRAESLQEFISAHCAPARVWFTETEKSDGSQL